MQELVALLQSAEKVPNDSDECGFDLEPLPLAPLSTLQVKPQAEVLSEIFSSRRISYTSLEVPLLPEFEGSAMLSEESEGSQIYKPSPVQSNYIQSAAPLLFAAQQNVDIPNVGLTQPQAVVVPCSAEEDKGDMQRYRNYQSSQWMDRYQELMQFRQEHGHLFVPHSYPPNQKLAQVSLLVDDDDGDDKSN